jgi:hypothetical protein
LKPLDKPLLRFNDATRAFHDGAVWAFGEKGRPSALLAFERYETKWAWELVSLSKAGLSAELVDGWKWAPKEAGLELRELMDAEAPADSQAGRLRQMRMLARRFAATQRAGSERYELRMLPQPVLRYADTDANLVDGALFAFVYGTNPEVIAVIECHSVGGGRASWHYAFAPLTTAPASASLDGKEVWSKAQSSLPNRQEPYTYFGDPAAKGPAP